MTLSDKTIRRYIDEEHIAIEGYDDLEEQVQPAGFDLRVGQDYRHLDSERVFNSEHGALVFEPDEFYQVHSIERISLPADILAEVVGRTSLHRRGLSITGGLIDPGYNGVVVTGVYNRLNKPIHVNPNHRFIQLEFRELDQPASIPYGNRTDSQYQGQEGF